MPPEKLDYGKPRGTMQAIKAQGMPENRAFVDTLRDYQIVGDGALTGLEPVTPALQTSWIGGKKTREIGWLFVVEISTHWGRPKPNPILT